MKANISVLLEQIEDVDQLKAFLKALEPLDTVFSVIIRGAIEV